MASDEKVVGKSEYLPNKLQRAARQDSMKLLCFVAFCVKDIGVHKWFVN